METILMQPNDTGKIKVLILRHKGNVIEKEHGILGGKMQEHASIYKAKNVGKSNEVSAEQSALNEVKKIIATKTKEGFEVTPSIDIIPVFKDPFDFDLDDIPKSFCCSKPVREVTEEEIDKVISSGSARFFVKYNGNCGYILINSKGVVSVYTRRWDNHTTKYPHIVEAVIQEALPKNTLLVVELCIDPLRDLDHMVAFKALISIAKTDTKDGVCKPSQEATAVLQEQYLVKAAVFGILYYKGEQLFHLPYKDNLKLMNDIIKPLDFNKILFTPQEALITSGSEAFRLAKEYKKKLEGFILCDTSKSLEISMNGKPKRRMSCKIKANGEMDVIAYKGLKGKVQDKYGSVYIGRYNKLGELVPMGTIGGLKPNEGETNPEFWDFPVVVEAEYTNIFPGTKNLQFGTFVKKHEDKKIEDVDLFEDID